VGAARDTVRKVVPHRYRHAVRVRVDALREFRDLPRRLDRLETLVLESHEQHRERGQRRWKDAQPDANLTFGRPLSGDAFVEKAARHGAFGAGKTIVEIGPGYGRLLEAAVRAGVEFERWVGIDLSAKNVAYLEGRFGDRASFVHADAETVALDRPADTVLSSLTLKHIYPSFETALRNVAAGAQTVVVDLIEGDRRYFQHDGATYIRWYRRDEVEAIFASCGFTVRFDLVEHDADHHRLLVVGSPA
jgi:SAM-dependent methyltransferase